MRSQWDGPGRLTRKTCADLSRRADWPSIRILRSQLIPRQWLTPLDVHRALGLTLGLRPALIAEALALAGAPPLRLLSGRDGRGALSFAPFARASTLGAGAGRAGVEPAPERHLIGRASTPDGPLQDTLGRRELA